MWMWVRVQVSKPLRTHPLMRALCNVACGEAPHSDPSCHCIGIMQPNCDYTHVAMYAKGATGAHKGGYTENEVAIKEKGLERGRGGGGGGTNCISVPAKWISLRKEALENSDLWVL